MKNAVVPLLVFLGLVGVLTGGMPAVARADLYSFVDEHGVLNITNVPTADPRYRLLRKEGGSPHVAYGRPRRGDNSMKVPGLDGIVSDAARAHRVEEALVRAVIHAESAYNPRAVSPKGATGLMQLMPATARRYGVRDRFDPTENVQGGVAYLRDLLRMFNHNLRLAVAAYNAGENSVLKYGGIPPYPETRTYVTRVMRLHEQYRRQG